MSDQYLSKVGVNPPIALPIGIGKRIASDHAAESSVIQFWPQGPQAGCDVAETFAVSQLRECHAEKLIAAGKIVDAIIASVAFDTLGKFVPGEKVHQLSENERFGVRSEERRVGKECRSR